MARPDRRWTAVIRVRDGRDVVDIPATDSEYDLLRDQTVTAVREAAPLVTDLSHVEVILFKTTDARGTERDRSFSVFRDRRGELRYW